MASPISDTDTFAEGSMSPSIPTTTSVPILTASRDVVDVLTPHNDKMGRDIVTLLIGPDKVAFTVHKARLIRRIPHFSAMFNGHFKETIDQEATFPEDDPATFDILLEWVYNYNRRKLREMKAITNNDGNISPSWDAVAFYKLAEKLMMPELQDMVMGALIRFQKVHNQLPSLSFIRTAYDETSEDGKLRLYASYALYHAMKQPDRQEEYWPLAEISAIMQDCDGACKDFLKLSMQNEVLDPRDLGLCSYHLHGIDDICPVTGKRTGGGRVKSITDVGPVVEKPVPNPVPTANGGRGKRSRANTGGPISKRRRVGGIA